MATVEMNLARRRPEKLWYVKNLCTVWWRCGHHNPLPSATRLPSS
jgi:hypothetical protein